MTVDLEKMVVIAEKSYGFIGGEYWVEIWAPLVDVEEGRRAFDSPAYSVVAVYAAMGLAPYMGQERHGPGVVHAEDGRHWDWSLNTWRIAEKVLAPLNDNGNLP
jgi:hypothetical protein